MKLQLTLGSDPELMLADAKTAQIVSALRILKQDKRNPIHIEDGIKMYADNVLVEASFTPASSVEGVVNRLRCVLCSMQATLGNDYFLVPRASHVYGEAELGPKPAVMKGQLPPEWEIGCMPSQDVYSGQEHIPTPFADGLRTGSFHIHIGNANFTDPEEKMLLTRKSKEKAIRLMDIFVGCPSILFDKDPSSPARRALYGKAGNFRPTKYGVEYRVLGNYALSSPSLTELVYELTSLAMSKIEDGSADSIINSYDENDIQNAINNADLSMAADIVFRSLREHGKFLDRVMEAYVAPMITDFYSEWKL